MAAAAACWLEMRLKKGDEKYNLKQSLQNVEFAARDSLKHNLGMTCDPINGLVIDPCIGRNAVAANAAYASA
jgi:L-serine dehydratase